MTPIATRRPRISHALHGIAPWFRAASQFQDGVGAARTTQEADAVLRTLLARPGHGSVVQCCEGESTAALCIQFLQLRRSISRHLFRLTALKVLQLPHNEITALPAEVWRLTRLRTLDLNHNLLCELPSTIGRLQRLTQLNLEDNHLEQLPDAIGHLATLKHLNLNHNRLTHLPPSIGDLAALQLGLPSGFMWVAFDTRSSSLGEMFPMSGNLWLSSFLRRMQIITCPREYTSAETQ